jgi:hypothetical protein
MTWDDEGAGRALGARLKLIEAPAHRVDLAEVVRAGRRQERQWRLGAGAGALALAAAAAVAVVVLRPGPDPVDPDGVAVGPIRPADCTITQLPDEPVADYVLPVDSTGRIVLGSSQTSNELFVWRDGLRSTVAVAGLSQPWKVTGMNSRGDIIGSQSSTATMMARPWIYRNGSFEWLPLPDGYPNGTATQINDNGDVAGWVSAPLPADSRTRVVIWPAGAHDRPVVLGSDGDAYAAAIGPDGTLVGTLRDGSASTAAAWTPGGEQRLLSPPPGWDWSAASAVGRDFAYGWASRPRPLSAQSDPISTLEGPSDGPRGPVIVPPVEDVERVPVRWNLRTGKVQILRNLAGSVDAASPDGWFVVFATPREGRTGAVLVSPTLQARALPGSVRSVKWVGAGGRTITGTVGDGSDSRPVVWNCR